ncbi:MAG: hypothetical protein M3P32_02530 [Chloroflexota bacterium]|nr:hypothetical protein [Chloroflexota bacterium]
MYPFQAAAFPVVYLYAQNVQEAIPPFDVLLPLGMSLGIALIALLIIRALTGSSEAAALITTLLVALFFTYGMAWQWFGDTLWHGHWVLAGASALVAVIGISWFRRLVAWAPRLTVPLNAVGGTLLAANVIVIGAFFLNMRPGVVVTGPGLTMSPAPSPGQELPDVYWVILDRYGSGNVIDKYYDYDNSPFLDELRARGFYVAEHATANYLSTALSIDSSRNMEYLDFAKLHAGAKSEHDWGPLYEGLSASFQVQHYLGSAGYRFIYLGTYWHPTAKHPLAEINYVYQGSRSEFLDVLIGSTMLSAFEDLGGEAPISFRKHMWNLSRYEWDSLKRASGLGGPKFVYAHFALPHPPYVFRADGSYVSIEEEHDRPEKVNYVDQLRFTNAQVLDWLDSLLVVPPGRRPVVIIQADEGPYPPRLVQDGGAFDWTTATPEELEHKFGILSAFYVPGKTPQEAGLYDSITPVNQFRAIFDAYFGLDLPMLPDRNWISTKQSLYDEIDVTEKVQR